MHWPVSKKSSGTTKLADAQLADDASNLPPPSSTSSIQTPLPQMTCSITDTSPPCQVEDDRTSVHSQPSTHPTAFNADMDVDPPSCSAIHPADSPMTSGEEQPSPTSTTKHPGKATKRFHSLKSAVEDGRATSFAKAACSGGMQAQACFLKAEAVTQAVKTGNVPCIAFNVARAAYKGGKAASQTWKAEEKKREDRLVKEGEAQAVEACGELDVEKEVEGRVKEGPRKASTKVEATRDAQKVYPGRSHDDVNVKV